MSKSERNGKRKKRSAFQTRVPDLGYYFIVTDTNETEANYKVASSLKYQKQKLMSLLTHVKNNPLQNHNLGNPGLCLTGIRLYPLIKLLLKLIMKASMLDGTIPAQKYGLIPILEGYTVTKIQFHVVEVFLAHLRKGQDRNTKSQVNRFIFS